MAGSGLDYDSQITKFMNQSGINQQEKLIVGVWYYGDPIQEGLYNRKFPQEKDWYFQEAIEIHIVICISAINIHEKQDTDVVVYMKSQQTSLIL